MSRVAILTDSTAYLPQKYVDQYSIKILPLKLIWQGKTYRDGIDIKANDFYKMLIDSDEMPSTSQISTHEYQEMYTKLLDENYHILVLPISSGISGSYFSALQAKEAFKDAPIEVLDTKLVAMALSFQVLAVARAAETGATLAECKELAIKAYQHIGVYFTVDTLKYLHKGGRIGSAKRLLGTALNIKPILQIQDGKIELVESVISRRKAIDRMLQLTEKDINGRTPVRISVFHAMAEDMVKDLEENAIKRLGAIESIQSEVSPVIGAHTGPGTLSIAYMAGL